MASAPHRRVQAGSCMTADAAGFKDDDSRDTQCESFETMPLSGPLLRGIYAHGFERPSPIQQRAILPMLRGGDVVAQAQAGTGKTGAFCIGILQRIDPRLAHLQALILAPTRELAEQTFDVIRSLGEYLVEDPRMLSHLFVGGTKREDDIKLLSAFAPRVAVGTPGRIADLIQRGALRASALRNVTLDEADEMLSQGFAPQVQQIFKFLPKDVQVALFSATLPPEVLEISNRFMRNPTTILVRQDALTLRSVRQHFVAVEESEKLACLVDLYESISIAQSVVFANTRSNVEWIANQLNANNHTVALLHAELPKDERRRVMAGFRSGASRVLVTSDLVCRGIDVQHVNVVINFELPSSKESYLHRIGRSGRCGKKGLAISFVATRERRMLEELQQHYQTAISELPMDFALYLEAEEAP